MFHQSAWMPELLDRNFILFSDKNYVSKKSSRYKLIVGQVFKSLCDFVWSWMVAAHFMSYGCYRPSGTKVGTFDLHGMWHIMTLLINNLARLEINLSPSSKLFQKRICLRLFYWLPDFFLPFDLHFCTYWKLKLASWWNNQLCIAMTMRKATQIFRFIRDHCDCNLIRLPEYRNPWQMWWLNGLNSSVIFPN